MNTIASHAPASGEISSRAHWTGLVMSGLVIAFLLFDSVIKLVPLSIVTETMAELGYPPGLERGLGVLTLVCVLLYAVP
ncbi:MAG: DoxX family protein, partial [Hyphomicrobiaceae bacterium]